MKKRLSIVLAVILALTMTLCFAACGGETAEPEKYTVTVENGTGGGTFEKGTEVTVTATVPEGKVFSEWTSGGSVVSVSNPYTFTVTENITLTAVFDDAEPEGPDDPGDLEELEDTEYFTVVADGGVINGEDGDAQVEKGTEVTIKAVVPDYYEFDYWATGGEKYTEEQEFKYTVTGNIKFESVLTAVSRYELTTSGCTHESRYEAGLEVVTVTANTPANYEFVNWTINGETVEAPSVYEFELTEDTTVTANFRRINIVITATSDDERIPVTLTSDNEDPDAETFTEGDTITVEAGVYNGIEVLAWRDSEGKLLSRDNPYTFEAADDIDIVAEIGDIYTVKVNGGTIGTSGKTEDIFGDGATCSVSATVGENETFVNWTDAEGTPVNTANPYVFTVKGDIELTANVSETQGKTYIFEAENADLTKLFSQNGDANCIERHEDDYFGDETLQETNYCSNGYIAACFNHTIGNVITWTVNSDADATAVMIMRMGSGAWISGTESADVDLDPETVEFRVNDSVIDYEPLTVDGQIAKPGASANAIYGIMSDYVISMEIQLKEGPNTIQMELLEINHGPNIDALKLTTTANLTWTPVSNGAPVADYGYNV